jgi:hypothetical protein
MPPASLNKLLRLAFIAVLPNVLRAILYKHNNKFLHTLLRNRLSNICFYYLGKFVGNARYGSQLFN